MKKLILKKIRQYLFEEYVDLKGLLKDMSQDDINEILQGYLECAIFTQEETLKEISNYNDYNHYDDDDDDEIEKLIKLKGKFTTKPFSSFIVDDIDNDSKIDAYLDIKTFIREAGDEAVKEAIEENGLHRLGMDIWYTRNDHGAGFFDHYYENEKILTLAAKKLKNKSIYIGDDYKLHFF